MKLNVKELHCTVRTFTILVFISSACAINSLLLSTFLITLQGFLFPGFNPAQAQSCPGPSPGPSPGHPAPSPSASSSYSSSPSSSRRRRGRGRARDAAGGGVF